MHPDTRRSAPQCLVQIHMVLDDGKPNVARLRVNAMLSFRAVVDCAPQSADIHGHVSSGTSPRRRVHAGLLHATRAVPVCGGRRGADRRGADRRGALLVPLQLAVHNGQPNATRARRRCSGLSCAARHRIT